MRRITVKNEYSQMSQKIFSSSWYVSMVRNSAILYDAELFNRLLKKDSCVRYFPTVCSGISKACAISLLGIPLAANSTIRERVTTAAGEPPARTRRSSSWVCSSDNSISGATLGMAGL